MAVCQPRGTVVMAVPVLLNRLEQREVARCLFCAQCSKMFKMFNLTKKKEVPETTGQVEVFSFSQEKSPIRVQLIDGEPWFVAKDVCEVLGIANHKDAASRLDDDERHGVGITDPIGRKQTVTAVSESGLYSLIFQSRKSEAKKFRKWVTSEVLPSIRKKGFYCVRKQSGDYIDARDVPYGRVKYNNMEIRTVEVDGTVWYSINDVNASMGARTDSSQCVRRLNAKREMARKIWLYGVPNPGWFTTELGVRLLMCASVKNKAAVQLTLDFDRKEGNR